MLTNSPMRPSRTIKPWGVTTQVFLGRAAEVHVASIRRGGHSSQHQHRSKANDFFVISGRLEILVYNERGDVTPFIAYVLTDGQRLTIPAGVWHRFNALEDTELIETYWLDDIGSDDIVRYDEGGLKPSGSPL